MSSLFLRSLLCCIALSYLIMIPSAVATVTVPTPMLRLVDVATRQNIVSSPLLGDVEKNETKKIPFTSLFSEDFESFSWQRLGWEKGGDATLVEGEKGQAIRINGGHSHRYAIAIPVQPGKRYKVSRSVLASDRAIDLRVLEMRARLQYPNKMNHPSDLRRLLRGRFVRVKDLLYVHRFPEVHALSSWQTDAINLFTTPHSHTLLLMVDNANSTVNKQQLSIVLDNITVTELVPNKQQSIGLLKYSDRPQPGVIDDGGLGLVKHGQLLPLHDAATVAPPYDRNHEYRYALFAPAPTSLHFSVTVPQKGRLKFSVALPKYAQLGDSVDFEILVATDEHITSGQTASKATSVYHRTVTLGDDDNTNKKGNIKGWNKEWRWFDEHISLASYAGKTIKLFLNTKSIAGTGYALWGNPVIDAPRETKDKPNVIVIGIDTLRADRLSSYGYSRNTSPHIDQLAREGTRFAHAMSVSNWTSSAFASLFTGDMPLKHQVIHRARAISSHYTTLPEYFRAGGWQTQSVAYKAYLYNMGFESGFDSWYNIPRANNTADDNMKRAMSWLEEHGDERFFLFLHFNDPHQPFNQPEEFVTPFVKTADMRTLEARLPLVVGTHNNILGCRRCSVKQGGKGVLKPAFKTIAQGLYDGEIAFVDNRIGQLIKALKQRGIYDHTIIVVVADHGEVIWDRDNYFGHGGKRLSDELIRVPFIIKPHLSARLPAGNIVDEPVSTASLLPTLLDLAEVQLPNKSPARTPSSAISLLSQLSGNKSDIALPVISENVKQRVLSVRDESWKYILEYRSARRSKEKLFYMENDLGEQTDVAKQYPQQLIRLRRYAVDHLVRNGSGSWLVVQNGSAAKQLTITINKPLKDQIDTGDYQVILGSVVPTVKRGTQLRKQSKTRLSGSLNVDDLWLIRFPSDFDKNDHRIVTLTAGNTSWEVTPVNKIDVSPREQLINKRTDAKGGAQGSAWWFYGKPKSNRVKKIMSNDSSQLEALRSLGYIQ